MGGSFDVGSDAGRARELTEIQLMLRRLKGFALVIDLDEATMRQIIRQVVADMPKRSDEERLVEARSRMIAAST